VVAEAPTDIVDASTRTIGAVPPDVSAPSAVVKAPAATSAAPARRTARVFVEFCMIVPNFRVCPLEMACAHPESLLPNWIGAEGNLVIPCQST
jgi:hypothetical protein